MHQRLRHPFTPRAYNSAGQLRVDVWNSIADLAKRLADPTLQPDDRTGPDRELGELLSLVAPVESYWAVPGPQHVGELRALVAAGDFELASRIAEPIAAEHGYVTATFLMGREVFAPRSRGWPVFHPPDSVPGTSGLLPRPEFGYVQGGTRRQAPADAEAIPTPGRRSRLRAVSPAKASAIPGKSAQPQACG
jgi:hypothetical protein